ncbi:MAG: matrixin family metalloprotease [Azoarcus sp.]|jgi:hypothetical protein|nr:matrixin family metalloprotease [Azoarcus sp.]
MSHRTKLLAVLASTLVSTPALALDISFDYSLADSFFSAERRDAMERAALLYESYILDDLNVVVTMSSRYEQDRNYLAEAGPTAYYANFQNDWSGTMTFNESYEWYSGTADSFNGYDFFSVTLHELGHILGIGTVNTWDALLTGDYFNGTYASGVYGGPVPLADYAHWLPDAISTLPGTDTWQEPLLNPYASYGTRMYLTALDLAGLRDIGWDIPVVPEPETLYMLLSGLGIVGLVARRQRTRAAA